LILPTDESGGLLKSPNSFKIPGAGFLDGRFTPTKN